MTEEKKNNEVQANDEANVEQADAKKKSGLIKYIIFGAAGIAIIAIIAFGTAYFLKDDASPVVQDNGGQILAAKDGGAKSAEQNQEEAQKTDEAEAANNEASEHQQQTAQKSEEHKAEPKSQTTKNEAAHAEKPAETPDATHEADVPANNEYALNEEEQKAIDKIMDNLEFLDYQPAEGELPADESAISVEDSIKEHNWLKDEKARLTQWESELNTREKELNKLQAIVDAKLAKLDQAEASRITQLAKLYDGMDARAVAQLMMNLDDDTVVSIIPRMKSQQASAVLQLIPSKRAARLSKQLITIAEN